MKPVSCFLTSVPRPIHDLNLNNNSKILQCRKRHLRVAVKRSPSMCRKQTDVERVVPTQQEGTDELDTEENIIESNSQNNDLRNTELAFILTSIATAVAGGPIIAGWSALYFLVGRQNDVPLWLCSLASLVCSALTDAFIWNFSNIHHSTGFIPYLLFASGTTLSAVFDFDEFFRIAIPSGSPSTALKRKVDRMEGRHKSSQTIDHLETWDQALTKRLDDKE
ncbi:unnamed protein product [Agarophyton chilense]